MWIGRYLTIRPAARFEGVFVTCPLERADLGIADNVGVAAENAALLARTFGERRAP